jgi:hypothetical protein
MRAFTLSCLLAFVMTGTGCAVQLLGEISDPMSDGVPIGHARIFLLPRAGNGALGGTAGADLLCQNAALGAGLKRNYSAMISTTTRSVFSLIKDTGTPVSLYSSSLGAVLVSATWAQIWNTQSILAPIRYGPNGQSIEGEFFALSGTVPSTGTVNGANCSDWTVANPAIQVPGDSSQTDSKWINSLAGQDTCDSSTPQGLYCIADAIVYE